MFQVYLSRVCFILALKCWRKNWSQCQIKQVQKNKWRTRQKVRTFKIFIRNLRCCTSARQWLECICSCRYIADFGRKEKGGKKKKSLPLKSIWVNRRAATNVILSRPLYMCRQSKECNISALFSGLLKLLLYNPDKFYLSSQLVYYTYPI